MQEKTFPYTFNSYDKEKEKVYQAKETDEGSGLYKINSGNVYNQSDINQGTSVFVGRLGEDYDAGSRTVRTPTGQIKIEDVKNTGPGLYDATKDKPFIWRVSDPGEDDSWWRQKW